MKILLVLLFPFACYAQNDLRIKFDPLKPIVLYSLPEQNDKYIIDTINVDDDDFWAVSIIAGKPKKYWHVYANRKVGYILDDYSLFLYDYTKDKPVRQQMEKLGALGDSERIMTTVKYAERNYASDSLKYAKFTANAIREGILIIGCDWSFSNEYSSFVDVDIRIKNYSKKTIKYIHFNFTAKDPVDGVISYLGKSNFKARGVGPIEQHEYATYTFEDLLYSKIMENIFINRIDIEYMDGSKKTITKIKDITL